MVFPCKFGLSVGYAGKMVCRIQDTILVLEAFSAGFLCFLITQTWSGGGGIERCCACLYVKVSMPHIPVLVEGRRRGEGVKVLVVDNTVAQNLSGDNTIHQTSLNRKDLQHLDRATRWGN
jgi:hypothetical protein